MINMKNIFSYMNGKKCFSFCLGTLLDGYDKIK